MGLGVFGDDGRSEIAGERTGEICIILEIGDRGERGLAG